jgi:hypothetical protein
LNTTVVASGVSTVWTLAFQSAASSPPFLTYRSMLHFTASASSGLPSLNSTPSRSLSVQDVPSALALRSSASWGLSCPAAVS